MFEQAELRGNPMGPNGPPTAKGTDKSPQKSPFRKPGMLGHFGQFEGKKTGHFGRFGRPILSQDGRLEENFHSGSGLDQRDRTRPRIRHVGSFAGARSKTTTWGVRKDRNAWKFNLGDESSTFFETVAV